MSARTGLPRILVPMAPLLESEAGNTVLITVELWPDRVHLRAVTVIDETTGPLTEDGLKPLPLLSVLDDSGTVYALSLIHI